MWSGYPHPSGSGWVEGSGTFLVYGVEYLPQANTPKQKPHYGFCYGTDAAAYAVKVTAPLKMPKE
jgi:hypothetical protein